MSDPAHKETDRLLKEMEKRIAREYKQAEMEVAEKLADYLRRFKIKDKTWNLWVKTGRKTEKEYKEWRLGQMAIGARWEELRQNLADDYHNANQIAKSIINGYMPEVYAINHNYATYEAESQSMIDTSYTLYDRQTVERIMRDNPDLLPPPGKKVSADIAAGKDIRWNNQIIQSVMMQSLLQGESIGKIATRLAEAVGDSNRKAAIRNARTMTTGAENAGRVAGYRRAKAMGTKMKQQWLATLDGRTRHEHRMLDGQAVDVGEPFEVGGYKIRFPGDPEAPAHLIYNCRCTLIGSLKGLEINTEDLSLRRSEKLGGMTYDEWKKSKEVSSNPILLPEEKASAIKGAYIAEYRGFPDNGVEKEQAEYKTKHFDDIEQAIENAYEYHRVENNMTSVPLDELGSVKSNVLSADFGKMSHESAKCFSETFSELIGKYDTPLQKIRTMNKQEALYSKAFASTGHNYSVDSAEIIINPMKCGDYEKMIERIRELSDNGYAVKIPKGKEDQYIATHEFGHSILNMTDKLSDKNNFVNADYYKIRQARKEINGLYNEYMEEIKPLSQKIEDIEKRYYYSLDSLDATDKELKEAVERLKSLYDEMNELKISDAALIDVNEFLAEAFTQAEIGTPGKYAKAVIDVIKRYFGR